MREESRAYGQRRVLSDASKSMCWGVLQIAWQNRSKEHAIQGVFYFVMLNADAYAVNGATLPRKCGLCRVFLALRPAKAFLASKDAVSWPVLFVYTRCSFKDTKMEGPDFSCLVQRRAQRNASAMDIDEGHCECMTKTRR